MTPDTFVEKQLSLSLCTGAGLGAVAVLVLEGEGALECAQRFCPSRTIRVGDLLPTRLVRPVPAGAGRAAEPKEQAELLDEIVLVALSRRRIELHVHGNPVLLARVSRAFEMEGVRVCSQSFEAWVGAGVAERSAARLLPQAAGDRAARVLLDQAEGAYGRAIGQLIEADAGGDRARVERGLAELLTRWEQTRRLLVPPRVVLAGPANAGKSTLFNLLMGEQRVLVAPTEGTTRDTIHQRGRLGAWVIEWIDTAGERELTAADKTALPESADQRVELAGQAAGREVRAQADLVLWLSREPGQELPAGALALRTCADLIDPGVRDDRTMISVHGDPKGAVATVSQRLHDRLDLHSEPWCPGAGSPICEGQATLLRRCQGISAVGERRELLLRSTEAIEAI